VSIEVLQAGIFNIECHMKNLILILALLTLATACKKAELHIDDFGDRTLVLAVFRSVENNVCNFETEEGASLSIACDPELTRNIDLFGEPVDLEYAESNGKLHMVGYRAESAFSAIYKSEPSKKNLCVFQTDHNIEIPCDDATQADMEARADWPVWVLYNNDNGKIEIIEYKFAGDEVVKDIEIYADFAWASLKSSEGRLCTFETEPGEELIMLCDPELIDGWVSDGNWVKIEYLSEANGENRTMIRYHAKFSGWYKADHSTKNDCFFSGTEISLSFACDDDTQEEMKNNTDKLVDIYYVNEAGIGREIREYSFGGSEKNNLLK
jgi:hypothetical protein